MSDANPDCVIRRLWPSDREAVQAHFRRLDGASRFQRFFGAVSDDGAAAYAARALTGAGIVYGAFAGGTLRGLGELRPAGGARLGPEAEAAFTIEAPFRGRGLGTALGRRLAEAGRNAGVRRLHMRVLTGNRPMRALARGLGAELRGAGRETHAVLALAPATMLSLWHEGWNGLFDAALAMTAGR
ncbi:GNAT family N-acetyltransferase [uncultured Methylobacterium sp.]|jgi:RimJ/RimL family protein N-acetyltransferase|uniref:GNAT family N-acetyltransferase n=1 Tax=uncultured Methylobacterium sp. TaxID=157278 RepID=UPI002609A4AE|nr:GNAT family N-acetyltransferase [uncultured Methylobacterium sp.]